MLNGFLRKATKAHGNLYDYSLVDYKNSETKITIICKSHGPFEQGPQAHVLGAGCPKCVHLISKPEVAWLDSLLVPEKFRHKRIYINKIPYNFDAYDPENKIIYEFYGDYWHGNPKAFSPNDLNKISKKLFSELFARTVNREMLLIEAGYKIISIWETDWNKLNGKKSRRR